MKSLALAALVFPIALHSSPLGKLDPWLPQEIALFPLELTAPHSQTRKIDFKTATRKYGDSIEYTVALISDSLNRRKSDAWNQLERRRGPQHAYHLGEIALQWSSKGTVVRHVFSGFAGYDFRSHERYGLIIGSFVVPAGKNAPLQVTFTVTRTDSVLAQALGPAVRLGIYRGGGK